MAEPRKITIKLRPVGAKPAGAPTPPAPPAAPAAEAPSAPEAPAAPSAAAPVAEAGAEAAQQAKRQTSRIELPPEITQQPMNPAPEAPATAAGEEQTIKLKPISSSAAPAKEETQAAKSKTARIALDSVLGGIQANAPLANTTQKTIKLKRATPAPSAKPKISAPMAPVGAEPAGEEKTIKLKRPATLALKRDAAPATPAAPGAEPELEPLEDLDDVPLAPLDEAPEAPAQESTGAKVFTIVSVVAACASLIVTLILCFVLQKQAASPDGSAATGNTLHSLPFKSF